MSLVQGKNSAVKFLSLRWTIIIFLSLILLLVNSTLAYLNYTNSTLQYDAELENVRSIQIRQIKALLQNGYTELSQISAFIPFIGNAKKGKAIENNFKNMLEQSGNLLDIEWDIHSLYLYSTEKKLLLSWPNISGLQSELPPDMKFSKTQINENLICKPKCFQFITSPVLEAGETIAYLLISRSIAKPVITFNQLTESEIVILSSIDDEQVLNTPSLNHLDRWGKYISAITNPEKSYVVIKQLENFVSLDSLLSEPHQLNIDNEWYEVYGAEINSDDIYVFVINSITDNKKQITAAAFSSALIGFIGLVLSEALLIFMLRSPVSSLVNLANNLPLLVEGEYQSLREKVQRDRKPKMFVNEIDVTLDAATELADRLESLQIARYKAEQELTWLADHDTLTELFNRRRFQTDFEKFINLARRYQHQGALLFMDLDAFKEINDLSGHMAGDSLLRQVADCMRQLIRNTDLLARLGGDEFAIVMPEATESQAIELAHKICHRIGRLSVFTETFTHMASISIGIAMFPQHGKNVPELMANADMAMYQSKKSHPRHVHVFSIDEQAREKLNQRLIVKDLVMDALDNDLFGFQYQPIIDVMTQQIKYYEALIRIYKKEGERIYPDAFIAVAEQTGLIRQIDQWVIEKALKVLLENPGIALSINLSSHALVDETVLDDLAEKINQSGIDPNRLMLEVTESGVIHNLNLAVSNMQKIRAIGCRFALDDFGTGFASYNHLKLLPVDIIKIDGCFIKNIEASPEDRLFVKSITEIGGSMNMQIVAEYVENGAILEILNDIGVQYAQGYHLGKPVDLDSLS